MREGNENFAAAFALENCATKDFTLMTTDSLEGKHTPNTTMRSDIGKELPARITVGEAHGLIH